MKFAPHGEVEVREDFPLLITFAEGPWNRELVDAWAEILLPHATAYAAQGPWVGVGVMRGSMLCTDGALERHRAVAQNMVDSFGAVGAVHVADSSVEGEQLMRGVFADMFLGLCPHAHFNTLEEARAWAGRLLAA